jgi:hypothetical protein
MKCYIKRFFLLIDLITRTLYKIRSLAEQQTIDCRTFCYFAPLLSQVIAKGGLGITASQIEESLEQVALAVDIISFAGPEGKHIFVTMYLAFKRVLIYSQTLF